MFVSVFVCVRASKFTSVSCVNFFYSGFNRVFLPLNPVFRPVLSNAAVLKAPIHFPLYVIFPRGFAKFRALLKIAQKSRISYSFDE